MRLMVIALLLLPVLAVHAYDGESNAVMFNVAATILGIPTITYERELNDDMSLAFSIALVNVKSPDSDSEEELKFNEFHASWRYYFSKKTKAIHGNFFYALAGGGSGEWTDEDGTTHDVSGSILGFGVGYKGIWESQFVQEISVGLNIVGISEDDVEYAGAGVGMAWSLGFTF
ncbi:DUF3575 domain-containing protein [Planctomycetota bacterium]